MAKRSRSPLIEFFLNLINSIFTISCLAIVSYALYCLLKLKAETLPHVHKEEIARAPLGSDHDISKWLSYELPAAWWTNLKLIIQRLAFLLQLGFIYLLLIIGASLVIISCFGYIGTATRSPCCLCFYFLQLVVIFVAQLCAAAFMFFNHDWKQDIPNDRSGSFNSTYHFFSINWKIAKWFAIGSFVLEAIAIVLTLYLRYVSRASYHTEYHRTIIYPDVVRRNSEKRRNPASVAPPAVAAPSGGGKQNKRQKSQDLLVKQ